METYFQTPMEETEGFGLSAIAPPPKVVFRRDADGNVINSSGVIVRTASGKPVTPAQAKKIVESKAVVAAQEKAQTEAAVAASTASDTAKTMLKYGIIGVSGFVALGVALKMMRKS